MAGVHDGEALSEDRVLSSHRAALERLKALFDQSGRRPLTWVDVGCGRGQILYELNSSLGDRLPQIRFVGCDGNYEYVEETKRKAEEVGLRDPAVHPVELRHGDLSGTLHLARADFVTLINVLHELEPAALAGALFDSAALLGPGSVLYVADVELLDKAELDSVCWSRDEIRQIADPLFASFSVPEDMRHVSRWGGPRSSWSFCLTKAEGAPDSHGLSEARSRVLEQMRKAVMDSIPYKLEEHDRALRAFAKAPSNIRGERDRQRVDQLAYEYWIMRYWEREREAP